jgi:hypothetical protein
MQDDIEKGTVNVQSAVVVKEPQFAGLIHEETRDRVVPIISASVS